MAGINDETRALLQKDPEKYKTLLLTKEEINKAKINEILEETERKSLLNEMLESRQVPTVKTESLLDKILEDAERKDLSDEILDEILDKLAKARQVPTAKAEGNILPMGQKAAEAGQLPATTVPIAKSFTPMTQASLGAFGEPTDEEIAKITLRAAELHSIIPDPKAMGLQTTAIIRAFNPVTLQEVNIVGRGTKGLGTETRKMLDLTEEMEARLYGAHGEMAAAHIANMRGLVPRYGVSSWKVCPICRMTLEKSGAIFLDDYTFYWPKPW